MRSIVDTGFKPHTAEDVLPGHPDRLADGIAESLVDIAVEGDVRALVGVEVGVHRSSVFVTGRIAAGPTRDLPGPLTLDLPDLAAKVYRNAGYTGRWAIEPAVTSDLDLGPLEQDERRIRRFSDDQNLVVGYAWGDERTGYLPPAVWAARRLRDALFQLRAEYEDELGPDGKVWVQFHEVAGTFTWQRCGVSLQHAEQVGLLRLHSMLLPLLSREIERMEPVLPGLVQSWHPELLRLNGAGDFSCGGPYGDNGLSGKKLVVDHYGPGVPIGGGALCGKDPHKVDRIGALRARQIAVQLVRTMGARDALVQLAYLPGSEAPTFLLAQVDGRWHDEPWIRSKVRVPDLSLEGSFQDLELASVQWYEVMRRGYFGSSWPWEIL